MNEGNLEPFIQATTAVFREIGFEITVTPSPQDTSRTVELIANIGITGDIKGFLILKSDLKSAHDFVNKMLSNMGMDSEEGVFGQFHKEAMGEILNQISGRTTMLLEEIGIKCDITPPTLLTGSNISSIPTGSKYHLNRDLKGSFGIFNFYVGIRE